MKRDTILAACNLNFRGLAFSEKFSTLRKVIANTSDIGKTVKNIRIKLLLIAITLLYFSGTPLILDNKVDVVVIDGIAYSHYFTSGALGRPCASAATMLAKKHQSCIAGHQQGLQIAMGNRADGSPITAIIAGSCYEHDEDYLGPQGNKHWRGILMLHAVDNGVFDLMPVSLAFLKRKYGD